MYTDSRVVSHPGTAQPGTCDAAAHAAADADATTPQQRSAPLERASLQRPASGQQDVVWSRCGDQSAGPRSPALAFGREVSQRPETFHAARFGRYPAQPQQQTRWPVTAAEQTLPAVSHVHVCSHFDVPVHVICGRLLCITFVWHCTYGTARAVTGSRFEARKYAVARRGAVRARRTRATRPGFF
jgi:hypothetical protein